MGDMQKLGLDDIVEILKAAGEPTRLRLLALLSHGDLTVTDLTDILGQSQPRISRHLKLLAEAALVDRYQEGAWAFFRLSQGGPAVALARQLLDAAEPADAVFARDDERLRVLKKIRSDKAQAYFSRNAAEWDAVRRLHVSEAEVEARLAGMIGTEPVDAFLDLGTGTGRILQLFEGLYRRGVGVDASRDMLAVARANLDRARPLGRDGRRRRESDRRGECSTQQTFHCELRFGGVPIPVRIQLPTRNSIHRMSAVRLPGPFRRGRTKGCTNAT